MKTSCDLASLARQSFTRRDFLLAAVLAASGCSRPVSELSPCEESSHLNDDAPVTATARARPAGQGGSTWPMFGGTISRNMVNTVDTNIPTDWSVKKGQQKNIKWAVQLGSVAYGGPVIADGKVFVATNNAKPRDPKIKGDKGILMCFREADGQFLWQAVHDKLPNSMQNDWERQGIASTPAVEGKRLYYVSNRCELVCADTAGTSGTATAKILWRLDMIGQLGVYPRFLASSSPLIVGDRVYVVTSNGVGGDSDFEVHSPEAPSFIAVDKQSGRVKWQDASPGKNIMEGQWTSPACVAVQGQKQILFPGGDGWLRAFDASSGKLIWKFDANQKNAVFKPGGQGNRAYFLASPVVYDNKVYIGIGRNPDEGEGEGHFWCLSPTKTGDVSHELVVDAKANPPKTQANPNSAMVWHYGGPISQQDQEKARREYYIHRTLSNPAIHDGLLYMADLRGHFYCLDAQTGKEYWTHDLTANVWGSPYWVDGHIYIGTVDCEVWIFKHGKTYRTPKRIEMAQAIKSTPVAANGVLYVLTESHLYAIANQ
jgi:outer membrane protein assembly factor BamB